jgi:hypothetical protein
MTRTPLVCKAYGVSALLEVVKDHVSNQPLRPTSSKSSAGPFSATKNLFKLSDFVFTSHSSQPPSQLLFLGIEYTLLNRVTAVGCKVSAWVQYEDEEMWGRSYLVVRKYL